MNKQKNNLIFACGFGWSGSGALIDFMLDFEKVEIFPGGETFFLKSLLNILRKVERNKKIDIDKGYHEQVFLGNVPQISNAQVCERIKWVFDNFISQTGIRAEEYRAVANKTLEAIVNETNESIINKRVTEYLIYLNNIGRNDNIRIFDNAIGAVDINLFQYIDFSFFENIFIYIVDRNPKDRFFELYDIVLSGYQSRSFGFANTIYKLIKRNKNLTLFLAAVYFTHIYNNKRKQQYKNYLKYLTKQNEKITWRQLMFEDIVLKFDQTKNIIQSDFNKILNTSYKDIHHFNPELSKKNIYKYKEIEDTLAIKYIGKFAK